MNKKDLAASIVFLVISVALFSYTTTLPVRAGAPAAMSAGFYPKMLSVLLGVLSLLMMRSSLKVVPVPEDCPPPVKKAPLYKTKGGLNMFLTLALLVVYPLILEHLGFAFAAFLFLAIMLVILTDEPKKHMIRIMVTTLLLTIVMYVIFKIILRIPFPTGLLF